MKKWVRRHPYLALALGYVPLFVFATAVWLVMISRNFLDAVFSAFMNTLVYWLLALFQLRRSRATKARLDENGQFRAYVRYPDSLPGSLSGIWNQGIATVEAGVIHFQPAVYENLRPSGRPTDFKVHEFPLERRKVTGKERRYLPGYGFRAVTLLTDEGKVELAASPESLDRLAEAVGSGPSLPAF